MQYKYSQARIKRHFEKPPRKQSGPGLSGIIKKYNSAVSFVVLALIMQLFVPALSSVAQAVVEPVSNPELGQACGLDIALVMDSSGSIDSTELAQMKSAFSGFVDALLPGTPTQFSVTYFGNTATVLQTFTSDTSLINSAINSPGTDGSTNWQDGLAKASSTFDPRPGSNHPNLIVFSSDGEPNKYGANHGPGNFFDQYSFEQAVTQANSIKNSGTRIITLGIGLTENGSDHLKAISGEDAYYDVADFGALAASLEQLATDLCGGTITAHKVIDADGDLNTTDDQTPGQGWEFDVAGSDETTDADGKTSSVEVEAGVYSVSETLSGGYSLLDAVCEGATGNGSFSGSTVSDIEVGEQDIVSCTFYNTPEPEPEPELGQITVCKIVLDAEGNIVTGSEAPGATFEVSWLDTTTSAGSSAQPIPSAVSFDTPLTFNEDLVSNNGNEDDAECVTISNLPLGHYYYGEEVISGGNAGWAEVLYSDQFDHPVLSLSDLGSYDGTLFDGNPADDDSRNQNYDGDINLTEGRPERTLVIVNQYRIPEEQDPDTTFHFIKQICPSYGDVEGNKAADNKDSTGGHYTEFKNYDSEDLNLGFGSDTVLPVHPDEIDGDCLGEAGWYFEIDDNNGYGSPASLGPTDGSGELEVPFSSLPEEAKDSLMSGGQMWVREAEQDGYGFAALRCYTDALNGDNSEFIRLGDDADSWPKDVYCIAYNVEEEEPDICVETELLENGGFEAPVTPNSWGIFGSGTSGLGWLVEWTEAVAANFAGHDRPKPANMELHHGVNGWTPSEGEQHAELDSDWDGFGGGLNGEPANVLISQTVSTVSGGDYKLTFDFSPRPGHANNVMEIYWNGALVDVLNASGNGYSDTNWNGYTYNLVGGDGTSTVAFKEIGTANSFGSLLDNVSLHRVCEEDPEEYADLRLTKSANPESVQNGEQSVFTITVVNGGADTAVNVVVDDLLPAGAGFVSATSSQGSYNDGTGEWNIGSLASGESATLEITVTITGEIEDEIVNIASVTSDTPDPDSGNNEDSATVTVIEQQECVEFILIVTKSGEGNGTVTGREGEGQEEIYCDTDECRVEEEQEIFERSYCSGTVVTLTANPDSNSNFDGSWSGDCSGTDPVCQLTIDGDKNVNAHFGLNPAPSGGTTAGSSGGGTAAFIPPTVGGGGDGEVLGITIPAPGLQAPEPEVLGETTELPRTGQSAVLMFLVLASFAAVLDRKYRLVN